MDASVTAGHLKNGVLTAALEDNATDYFLYKGQPMGYHLELMESLCRHLGCQLEIVDGKTIAEQEQMLSEGRIDLIASNFNISPERTEKFLFSKALYQSPYVLVQLKARHLSDTQAFLQDMGDLDRKEIHVRAGSSFEEALRELNRHRKKREKIRIRQSSLSEEELLQEVAFGNIPYTVASLNKAKHFSLRHKQIDYHLQLSPPQAVAWAMRLCDDSLQTLVNHWIDSMLQASALDYFFHKYYELPFSRTVRSAEAGFRQIDKINQSRRMAHFAYLVEEGMLQAHDSLFFKQKTYRRKEAEPVFSPSRISPFDSLLKKHSPAIPWDWRLLASLIYQESQFQSHLVSSSGAIGLMQMMPATARRYGITARSDEEAQIEAGVAYIKSLYAALPASIGEDQELYFVLAAYNTGPGHVRDAMRLARKYGADPYTWHGNVARYLLLKSKRRYYQDPVCRHGRANGRQAVDFVDKVEERYMHYCNIVP